MTSTALVTTEQRDDVGVVPAFALKEAKAAMDALTNFVREQLIEGEDFGTIPGTPKPSLFQPGADKIAFYYALSPVPHLEREVMTPEFVSKTYRVDLVDRRTGRVVASCSGSCNSSERRFSKTGKPSFTDARETENTCDKMAQKRAKVGAVIAATRASGLFTQDVEDLPREQRQEAQEPITRDTPVTWGKDKGTPIKMLDDAYLAWGCQEGRKFGPRTAEWQKAMMAELQSRKDGERQAIEAGRIPEPDADAGDEFPRALEEPDDDLPF